MQCHCRPPARYEPGSGPRHGADALTSVPGSRHEEHTEPHRCEFRYGSLVRSVTLPAGADTEHITASYNKGILEITVPVPEAKAQGKRHIEVTHG